jgi:hypothetical protein
MEVRRPRVEITVAVESASMEVRVYRLWWQWNMRSRERKAILLSVWNMCSRQEQVQLCQMQTDQKVHTSHTSNHLRDLAVDPIAPNFVKTPAPSTHHANQPEKLSGSQGS